MLVNENITSILVMGMRKLSHEPPVYAVSSSATAALMQDKVLPVLPWRIRLSPAEASAVAVTQFEHMSMRKP